MKSYIYILMATILSISCNKETNDIDKVEDLETKETKVEQPKGKWKVDKEFDEYGNLIGYDSIYSWSSHDNLGDLSTIESDSLVQSFRSRFYRNFSSFEDQGFNDIFSKDSLFSQHFFNDDFFESSFGKDFMDMDRIMERMMERQRKFLEKYQSEFITPEEEN